MYGYGRGYSPLYYGFDWTYLIIIGAFLLSLLVQGVMKSTFNKYCKVLSRSGMTGADVARAILQSEGIYDVQIYHISGNLNDHFDPRNRTISLSDPIYSGRSVAALGVAAHECGHAIQHTKGYAPLNLRSALVPLANFGTGVSWYVFIAGLFLANDIFLKVGIFLFVFGLAFQIVTLPVEFNASRRALQKLKGLGIMANDEVRSTRKVLSAAAMTYVAAACASFAQLLRMILLANSRNRD